MPSAESALSGEKPSSFNLSQEGQNTLIQKKQKVNRKWKIEEISEEKFKTLSQSKKWLKLLHYKSSLLPWLGLESELDGKGFFLSENGKNDPKAELIDSAKSFSKNIKIGPLKQHPQCAFPERYRFIKSKLSLDIKDVKCQDLDDYLKRYDPSSATLVFSSAYQENPGSMFGHTFLRINRRSKSNKSHSDLLDYGISFAAQVPDHDNGLSFAVAGLVGGYVGRFSFEPFYLKVKEYNNSESRDLWEYELNLNREEILSLLRHVWEIHTNSYFDYYFLDENCSYQILTLLESVKPEWELSNFGIYTIPIETVKKLKKIPGAIKKRTYRASLRNQAYSTTAQLSAEEKDQMQMILSFDLSPEEVTSPNVIASTSGFLRYLKTKHKMKPDWKYQKTYENLLARSSVLPTNTLNTEKTSASIQLIGPDEGHSPMKFGLGFGQETLKNFEGQGSSVFSQFSFKLAYHDLLNLDTGYTPYSQIDFPGFTLRHSQETGKLRLKNLEGFHITSLTPLNNLEKKLSWQMRARFFNSKSPDCSTECNTLSLYGGVGPAFSIFSERHMAYIMLMARSDISNRLQRKRRVGPVLESALLFQPTSRWKFSLKGSAITDVNSSGIANKYYNFINEHSLSLEANWELRASLERYIRAQHIGENSTQLLFSLNHYL